jgi:hypothetical protein
MPGTVQGESSGGLTTGSGQTVGTATTALLSLPGPATGIACRIEGSATGYDATNGAAVSLSKVALVRNASGTVALAGSVLDVVAALGDVALTGASATFAVSGSNVEFRVTGVLTKTINWTASVRFHPTL